jgi:O-antigen/teichoic acid export membrane protein
MADPGRGAAGPPVREGGPHARDQQLRRLARRGSASLAGSAVTAVAQFGLTVAVARGLTHADAGLFFAATSLFLILSTVARLGTPTGLVWALSGQLARGEPGLTRPTLRTALVPVLGVGVVTAVALAVWAEPVADLLLPADAAPALGARLETIVRAMAVFVPVAAAYDAVCAATRAADGMRVTVVVERIGRPVLQFAAVAVTAFVGSSVAVSLAWLVPYVGALALAAAMLWRIVARVPAPAVRPQTRVAGTFWRFTGPRALADLALTVQQRLDIVLVGALRGPRDAAIYAAATRFLVLGQAAAMAISLAVQPDLGATLGVDDRRAAHRVYRTATAWLMVVTWPLYLFAFVAPELILAVFGPGYLAGEGVIRVLAATMLVATGCGMVDMVLTMAGRSWWSLANVALGVTVFVTLNLLLIPRFGIVGAALAWASAILVKNLVPLAQVARSLGLHPFDRGTGTAAAWALTACGVFPWLLLAAVGRSPGSTGGVLAAATAVYLAGLYALRTPLRLTELPIPAARVWGKRRF